MDQTYIFVLFVMVVGAYFGYRVIRYKGLRGALFGAEIRRTVGEVEAGRIGPNRTVLRVHKLGSENPSGKNVGLEIISKGIAGYATTPVVLSRAETATLIALLQQANQ